MRYIKLFSATVLIGAVLATSACDDGLAEINENPNAPTDVPANNILPEVTRSTVNQWYYSWYNLEFTGAFAQYFAKIQYTDEDQYALRTNVIQGFWDGIYSQDLKDWQTIADKGEETGLVNHQAVGMIGKVYSGHFAADIWGAIPWSQALQADAEEAITAPAYDAAESVYTSMLADLGTATSLINPGARSFGSEDLIYGGDMEMWRRFGNSLRLRLAMRISDVAESTAKPIVESLASQPLIVENSQNAMLRYPGSAPNVNPLYDNRVLNSRNDHAVSITMVNKLGDLNDPRLTLYAEPATSEATPGSITFDPEWCGADGPYADCHVVMDGMVYRGMRNGVDSDAVPTPFGLYSPIGDHWRFNGQATPAVLFSAAETHFLLAEAAQRGWNVGSAQAHFEAGVRAAFDMWDGADGVNLGPAVQDAYLASLGALPAGEAGIEMIIDQKWIAMYPHGPEAYAEYRRTGYPAEIVPSQDALMPFVPGRIPYPDLEQSLNEANVSAAIASQPYEHGGYGGALWWDPEDPAVVINR